MSFNGTFNVFSRFKFGLVLFMVFS